MGIGIKLCLFRQLLGSPNRQSTATTNFGDKRGKIEAIGEIEELGKLQNLWQVEKIDNA